ncbi:MAG TPA: hypothetical protein VF514_15270 [Bacteroidota bacterium]
MANRASSLRPRGPHFFQCYPPARRGNATMGIFDFFKNLFDVSADT